MVLKPTVWSNRLVGLLLPLPWGSKRYFPMGTLGWRVFIREGRARRRLLREGRLRAALPSRVGTIVGWLHPSRAVLNLPLLGLYCLIAGSSGYHYLYPHHPPYKYKGLRPIDNTTQSNLSKIHLLSFYLILFTLAFPTST